MSKWTSQTSSTTDGDNADAPKEDASVEAVEEAGGDEVQKLFDEAAEKGYFGESQDDTPRENYTASGVGQGLPTPETDTERRMNQPRRSY